MSTFVVCGYQGNVYVREVHENDTTVYMDTEFADFDTYEEADKFASGIEDDYYTNYHAAIEEEPEEYDGYWSEQFMIASHWED